MKELRLSLKELRLSVKELRLSVKELTLSVKELRLSEGAQTLCEGCNKFVCIRRSVKDVIQVTGDYETLLSHRLLKYLLERRWGPHTNDLSGPFDQVLKLWFEFNGQVPKPCIDATTNNIVLLSPPWTMSLCKKCRR